MLDRVCPGVVSTDEAWDDSAPAPMFVEEERSVATAILRRRQEYATVRLCARRALDRIGVPAVAIVAGAHGAPIWPSGVVGSLTHCSGFRGAAIARSADVVTLGIDAEPHAALPRGVLGMVASQPEVDAFPTSSDFHWDRILFCAKEAFYKAWFPLAERFLGFTDAEVHLGVDGTFTVAVLVPLPRPAIRVARVDGRWAVERGIVAAAVTVAE